MAQPKFLPSSFPPVKSKDLHKVSKTSKHYLLIDGKDVVSSVRQYKLIETLPFCFEIERVVIRKRKYSAIEHSLKPNHPSL